MNPPEPGWYRDPYFKNRERYWDGEMWTDECRLIQPALPSGQHAVARPVPGEDPWDGTWCGPTRSRRSNLPSRRTPFTPQQPAAAVDPVAGRHATDPDFLGHGGGCGRGCLLRGQRAGTGRAEAGRPPVASPGHRRAVGGSSAAATADSDRGQSDGGSVRQAAGAAGAARTATGRRRRQSQPTDTTSTPATKAEAAANAERVRTVGAAAILGGDIPGDDIDHVRAAPADAQRQDAEGTAARRDAPGHPGGRPSARGQHAGDEQCRNDDGDRGEDDEEPPAGPDRGRGGGRRRAGRPGGLRGLGPQIDEWRRPRPWWWRATVAARTRSVPRPRPRCTRRRRPSPST